MVYFFVGDDNMRDDLQARQDTEEMRAGEMESRNREVVALHAAKNIQVLFWLFYGSSCSATTEITCCLPIWRNNHRKRRQGRACKHNTPLYRLAGRSNEAACNRRGTCREQREVPSCSFVVLSRIKTSYTTLSVSGLPCCVEAEAQPCCTLLRCLESADRTHKQSLLHCCHYPRLPHLTYCFSYSSWPADWCARARTWRV